MWESASGCTSLCFDGHRTWKVFVDVTVVAGSAVVMVDVTGGGVAMSRHSHA